MDKIDKIVGEFLSSRFEDWKPYLNENEQAVFILHYFKGKKIEQICVEINFSERQVYRILKSARKKIYKLLP